MFSTTFQQNSNMDFCLLGVVGGLPHAERKLFAKLQRPPRVANSDSEFLWNFLPFLPFCIFLAIG